MLEGRLQHLRLAPRQPRGDDARHLRQRAHQEPDDPGRRPTARARKAASRCSSRRGEKMFIYDAAMKYMAEGTPTVDLRRRGVRHRLEPRLGRQGHAAARHQGGGRAAASSASTAATWSAWACCRCSSRAATRGSRSASRGDETFDIELGAEHQAAAGRDARHHRAPTAAQRRVPLTLRIDTPIEVDYYKHGGILPFVLRQLLAA